MIKHGAHNKAGYGKAARAAAMTAKRTNTGAIVGGVIGGLCLVAVGIAAFVFRDKFKSIVSRGETHRKSSEIKLKKNTCSDNVEKEHLWEYIADLQEDTHRGLEEEFSQLQARCKDHPTDAATAPFNKRKNRFINILPYDHSRVKLSEINGIAGSDYINANYIKDHRGQSNFIATQGPKENTIEDFWRMVWEQKVYTIVMLTNLTEKGKRKCEKYWPDTNDQPLEWDNACVTLQAEERDSLYVTRLLEFSMGHRKRIMKQFHYLAWPDFGVPTSEEHLLNFIADVRDATASSSGPIIVHCSAGVGRTGTFIGLWNLMDNVNEDPGASSINVNKYVMAMRRNRPIMVQSQEQYLYLYKCIATYIDNPGKWGGNSETTNDDAVYENFGYEPPIYENL